MRPVRLGPGDILRLGLLGLRLAAVSLLVGGVHTMIFFVAL